MWPKEHILVVLQLLLLGISNAVPREGYGSGHQDWGFVEVREGAHMFWWLYYTTADVRHYSDRPLVIWIQGELGVSSTFGNFEEVGPLTLEGNSRKNTWVKNYNVLFIDNPVGTGFSYVDDISLLSTNNTQIAQDLVTLTKQFYMINPELKRAPVHIYAQSYGGKIAPEYTYLLHKLIKNGELDIQLKTIIIAAPLVSPIDSLLSFGDYLLNMGFVDTNGYKEIKAAAIEAELLLKEGKYIEALEQWAEVDRVMQKHSLAVDNYNVLRKRGFSSDADSFGINARLDMLDKFIRGPVTTTLNLTSTPRFKSTSHDVYDVLRGEMMKPAIHVIELLLNETNVDIAVITGQLDLIAATPGTIVWIEKLQWEGRDNYLASPRDGIGPNGVLEGYQKSYGKLHMYWALRAGHIIPVDNPVIMDYILQNHTGYP